MCVCVCVSVGGYSALHILSAHGSRLQLYKLMVVVIFQQALDDSPVYNISLVVEA